MLNLLERLLLNTMKRNKNTEKNYILITGADSGIGKQFAIQYSNIGYKIILTARNLEKLKAVQAELKTESVIIIKDLSIMDNCYELLKEVEQYKIDMFINNAMCLTDRRVFKLMCLGLCLMAIVTAKLPRE